MIRFLSDLFRVAAWAALFYLSLFQVQAEEVSNHSRYSVLGSAEIGTMIVPYQSEWLPILGMDAVLDCSGSSFCSRYPFSFLRTHIDVAFSNVPYLENGYTRPKEHHIPYLQVAFQAADFRFRPWLQLGMGKIQILRAPRFLYNGLNLQAMLAHTRFHFFSFTKSAWQSQCWLEVAGPGVKFVSFSAWEAVPFLGVDLLLLQQGCQAAIGKRAVSGLFGYAAQTNASLGQSGDGKARQSGNFGAIHHEHRVFIQSGLQVAATPLLQNVGIAQFRLIGWASFRFDGDQGCLQKAGAGTVDCGNSLLSHETQLGLQLGVDFASPSVLKQKTGLLFQEKWPSFAL